MDQSNTLTIESDWLPAAELRRLLEAQHVEFPDLTISSQEPGHRGIDPVIAVAIISGVVTIAVPFLTKLAERLFAMEPAASVTIISSDDKNTVELRAALPAAVANQLVERALTGGGARVRIGLPTGDGGSPP